MRSDWVTGDGTRIRDRSDKVAARRRRMPVQGRALKRLLIERANAAAKQRQAQARKGQPDAG